MSLLMDTSKVTRFEVIDENGRLLTRYATRAIVDLQDDGRTLKVFLTGLAPEEAEAARQAHLDALSRSWDEAFGRRTAAPPSPAPPSSPGSPA